MGLLEKSQQRKVILQETQTLQEPTTKEKKKTKSGLLEKAEQRKKVLQETQTLQEPTKKGKKTRATQQKKKTEKETQPYTTDERKGFGWKGLGSRKIVFDKEINEYVYQVSEPSLNEEENNTKDELVRSFLEWKKNKKRNT
jgi:hypothetical protein